MDWQTIGCIALLVAAFAGVAWVGALWDFSPLQDWLVSAAVIGPCFYLLLMSDGGRPVSALIVTGGVVLLLGREPFVDWFKRTFKAP